MEAMCPRFLVIDLMSWTINAFQCGSHFGAENMEVLGNEFRWSCNVYAPSVDNMSKDV